MVEKQDKAPKAADKAADGEALRAEIKAFATSLGFVPGASFDYDDFAPEKAAKKIKPAAGKQHDRQQLPGPPPEPQQQPQQHDRQQQRGPKQQQQQQGRQEAQQRRDRQPGPDAARGRQPPPPPQQQQQQQRQDDGQQRGKGRQQQEQQQPQRGKGRPQQEQELPPRGKGRQQEQQQQQQSEEDLERVRSRTWVDSVGPRPGEARGRSLLGKDEPTIWHEAAAGLPALNAGAKPPLSEAASEALRQRAEGLLQREAELFEREMAGRNAADARWLAQVRRSGTTADKVAAMSLLVSSGAAANLKSLDGLLGMMAKTAGGRQLVVAAMEALQELFLTSLLPDRKLRVLEQQPLQVLPPGKDGERCLLLWAVEDTVKQRYSQFVQQLEKCSTDPLDFIKEKATRVISRCLSAKPEAEQALLSALVNKLGDPSRKLASDAAYLLGQLLLEHPAMKPVVVREVERFVFRPGLTDRARYYSVTFLNQLALSHRDSEGGSPLAAKLITIYFSLFKLLLEGKLGTAAARRQQQQGQQQQGGKKRGQQQGRKGSREAAGQEAEAVAGEAVAGAAGGRGAAEGEEADAEDERADAAALQTEAGELDARMLSALITGVRRAFPYVAAEAVEPLVEAHSEALFRLVHTAPFTVALQALMLMHQLLSGRNAVSDRFYRALYAVLLTEGAKGAAGVRAPQFMSLLVKAMKADVSLKRVAAFAKRLLQVALHTPAHWAAGGLLLLSEVLRSQPGLWQAVQQPEDSAAAAEAFRDVAAAAAAAAGDSDDDDEVFRDVVPVQQEEEQQGEEEAAEDEQAGGKQQKRGAGGKGKRQQQQQEEEEAGGAAAAAAAAGGRGRGGSKWPRDDCYDMRKREPLYAHAEGSCWWELLLLARHSHPSVAAFARSLLAGSHVAYAGDPLRDLGLAAFLDKFVNKKPKAAPRGSSLMQPTASHAAAAAAQQQQQQQQADVAVLGGAAFAALAEAEVRPDQMFFHKFFTGRAGRSQQVQRAKAKAARAAAADASGLGELPGLGSDDGGSEDERAGGSEGEEEELGELGDAGFMSDDDFDQAAADRALEEAEGVGDDELGDPDVGWDYDQLLAAMEEEGDDVTDDENDSDNNVGDEGGSGGSDDGGSSSSEEEGEEEEGEWVMMEGAAAAAAAAAAGDGGGGGGAGKQKGKQRKRAAAADVSDAELAGLNVFELASPGSSSDDEQQQQQSRKKAKKQQQQQQEEDEEAEGNGALVEDRGAAGGDGSDSDLDLDLADIIGGESDEEGDDVMLTGSDDGEAAAGGSSDEEAAPAAGKRQQQGKRQQGKQQQQEKRKKGGRGGGELFASADSLGSFYEQYEEFMSQQAELEKQQGEGKGAGGGGGGERRHQHKRQQRGAGDERQQRQHNGQQQSQQQQRHKKQRRQK